MNDQPPDIEYDQDADPATIVIDGELLAYLFGGDAGELVAYLFGGDAA